MYMIEMIRHLERRGFLAHKEYDSNNEVYIFRITKDGVTYEEAFKYPASGDWRYKDNKQKEFLNRLVENFYIYITRKEEEKEMKNNWKISNATRMGSGLTINLTRENIGSFGVSDITEVVAIIDNALNRGDPERTTYHNCRKCSRPTADIKDVIFNPPATIVFWKDGTKTVVKAGEFDTYDPEKGLAMAITKKVLGNEGKYYNEIRKWLDKYYEDVDSIYPEILKLDFITPGTVVKDLVDTFFEKLKNSKPLGTVKSVEQTEEGVKAEIEITDEAPWKIYSRLRDDEGGKVYGVSVRNKDYKRKCDATRVANKLNNENTSFEYIVSKTNPWGDPTCQE